MVDPVNLTIPGPEFLLFSLMFFGVAGFFTLVLTPIEIAIQREHQSRASEERSLLESRRVNGEFQWIEIRSPNDQGEDKGTHWWIADSPTP